MADIASIVEDAVSAGLDPRRLAFASVYMRFAERASWESAAKAAENPWEIAAYSTGQGHMLRLSRRAHPTTRDLAKLRAEALVFAGAHAADWLSMSLEDLQQAPSAWEGLSVHEEIRLPEQRHSSDIHIDNDTEVQPLQQGGPA